MSSTVGQVFTHAGDLVGFFHFSNTVSTASPWICKDTEDAWRIGIDGSPEKSVCNWQHPKTPVYLAVVDGYELYWDANVCLHCMCIPPEYVEPWPGPSQRPDIIMGGHDMNEGNLMRGEPTKGHPFRDKLNQRHVDPVRAHGNHNHRDKEVTMGGTAETSVEQSSQEQGGTAVAEAPPAGIDALTTLPEDQGQAEVETEQQAEEAPPEIPVVVDIYRVNGEKLSVECQHSTHARAYMHWANKDGVWIPEQEGSEEILIPTAQVAIMKCRKLAEGESLPKAPAYPISQTYTFGRRMPGLAEMLASAAAAGASRGAAAEEAKAAPAAV